MTIEATFRVYAESEGEFSAHMATLGRALSRTYGGASASAGEAEDAAAETATEKSEPRTRRTRGSTASDAAKVKADVKDEAAAEEKAAAPEPEVEQKKPVAEPAPTLEDVRGAMTMIIDKLGDEGPQRALDLLAEVGGAKKASELPEDKRAAYIKAAEELVAKAK